MYLYLLNTLADWETGYVIAELGSGRYCKSPEFAYTLIFCGKTRDPITTMGGLILTPEITLAEITPGPDDLLILPGGDTWFNPEQNEVLSLVPDFMDAGMVVGAICGATMGLAQAGHLNSRPHTSNDPDVLRMFCPGYAGSAYYQNQLAVLDGNLITASGLAPVEFADQIFSRLGVMHEATRNAWYQLYTTRRPEFFHALMASLQ